MCRTTSLRENPSCWHFLVLKMCSVVETFFKNSDGLKMKKSVTACGIFMTQYHVENSISINENPALKAF
jgi:hypothetical protein